MGLQGNEEADKAAKLGCEKQTPDILKILARDFKNAIKQQILSSWQREWDAAPFKLKQIKDTVKPWASYSQKSRVTVIAST